MVGEIVSVSKADCRSASSPPASCRSSKKRKRHVHSLKTRRWCAWYGRHRFSWVSTLIWKEHKLPKYVFINYDYEHTRRVYLGEGDGCLVWDVRKVGANSRKSFVYKAAAKAKNLKAKWDVKWMLMPVAHPSSRNSSSCLQRRGRIEGRGLTDWMSAWLHSVRWMRKWMDERMVE